MNRLDHPTILKVNLRAKALKVDFWGLVFLFNVWLRVRGHSLRMYCGKQQSTIVVIDDGDSSFECIFAHSRKLLLDNIYLMQVE